MASGASGKRRFFFITATVLVGVGVGLGAAMWAGYHWAVARNAVALLDSADKVLRGGDGGIREVARAHYGPDPAQTVEMFLPADATGPLPVLVFVHGGGWSAGNPADYRFIARALAPHGFAVVLAGYRLYPKVRYPAMLEDGAGALRWVADHARDRGGDPARVVLMGHSAGAYNVLMLALDQRWMAARGLDANALRGVVSLAGPADFYPFTIPQAIHSFGAAPDPLETQPVTFARPGAPPLLLVHGTADETVKPRNSIALAGAMTRAGAPTAPVLLDGVSHEGVLMLLARPFSADARVYDAVLPFLKRVTAPVPASPPVQAPAG